MTPALDLAPLAAKARLGAAQIHLCPLGGGVPGRHLDDGRSIYAASMIKVPLACAVTAAIAGGRLRWDSPVVVDARNSTVNDAPSPLLPGYVTSIDELVTLMLQRSDNVATNELFDVLGREQATADLHALGWPEIFLRRKLSGALPLIDDPQATGRNAFSARDAASLFGAIARDLVPGAADLRRILATSWWDVKLSRGLEPGDRFAHKTGDTDEGSHDGGILTLADSSRWVLVVYTELPSSEENDLRFGAFMKLLRPHLRTSPDSWSTG